MTQYVEILVSGVIPENDGFIGYNALAAVQNETDALIKALEAKGIIDVKAKPGLVNKRPRTPIVAGEATMRAVPRGPFDPSSDTDEEAA
jgi:hypothetical protein